MTAWGQSAPHPSGAIGRAAVEAGQAAMAIWALAPRLLSRRAGPSRPQDLGAHSFAPLAVVLPCQS
jgi:hypothetical protein